jgi:hypothetical protein
MMVVLELHYKQEEWGLGLWRLIGIIPPTVLLSEFPLSPCLREVPKAPALLLPVSRFCMFFFFGIGV